MKRIEIHDALEPTMIEDIKTLLEQSGMKAVFISGCIYIADELANAVKDLLRQAGISTWTTRPINNEEQRQLATITQT